MQNNIQPIIKTLEELHSSDKEQIEVIFTKEKRVIVEAPAGYGKTKTMIGRIAYLIASGQVSNPKRILALTFSVNASYKIKRDVAENLPKILSAAPISPVNLKNKVFATNYHGFCRRVLRLYGYLIDPKLTSIDLLKAVDDSRIEDLTRMDIGLGYEEAKEISDYNEAVKKINKEHLSTNYSQYLKKVKTHFLRNDYIPFNAILLLTLDLFAKHHTILEFYKTYFPIIIVDEFQDTNILSWSLLQKIFDEKSQIMLMGDSLQRIYGFIGAIPNLMQTAQRKYNLHRIELKANHRFKNNQTMLLLDRNIRENAKNPYEPAIKEDVNIKIFEAENQEEEATGVLDIIQKIRKKVPEDNIAVLVKQRNRNTQKILEIFRDNKLDFFYALYTDEDPEYVEFHKKSLDQFIKIMSTTQGRINTAICQRFIKRMENIYKRQSQDIHESLLTLLKTFIEVVFTEFKFLTIEDKTELIRDTLENRSLRQYLGYVGPKVLISTVHAAKGLEWEMVILPDMEQFSFPNWFGLCGECEFKNSCNIQWENVDETYEKKFYDELSVFYVAATRAKKHTLFSYSQTGIDFRGRLRPNNLSCLAKLKGIKPFLIPLQNHGKDRT
jgi:DNA helicase-2/ATP-dependent DNA helicase PcrA